MEYFVEILKEHGDDDNRKSLLVELKVSVRLGKPQGGGGRGTPRLIPPKDSEKFMFSLESLASLQGIKDVEIEGVPEWFAKCLQLRIQGKGGEIETVDWPPLQFKQRKGHKRKAKEGWRTSRKWYQPMLNWKQYAECNHIAIPADIDKYWKVEDERNSVLGE